MKYRMKELPKQERPYERCLQYGAGALSDAELLAVILRSGASGVTSVELACEVLKKASQSGNLSGLCKVSIKELCDIKGIGKVKAIQIKCIAELAVRISKTDAGEKIIFKSAFEIAEYYMEDLRHCDQEHVMVLSFNTKGRLLGEQIISKGTFNQSLLSPREIFIEALEHKAAYIILIHNHPSGDPSPSKDDHEITQRVCHTGHLLGIACMDHIIIGDMCYYSFRENNCIKE